MALLSKDMSRTRALGMVLLAVTFLVGGLAGAALVRALSAQEVAPSALPQAACDGKQGGKEAYLIDRLDLSAEQRVRIEGILEQRRGQTEAFWHGEGRRLRGIVDSTRKDIRAVLTPEQQAEYDRLLAEHRARKRGGGAAKHGLGEK